MPEASVAGFVHILRNAERLSSIPSSGKMLPSWSLWEQVLSWTSAVTAKNAAVPLF